MIPRKLTMIAAGAAVALMVASPTFAADDTIKMSADDAKAKQAYALGVQAYIWGFPMVKMQGSRDLMTTNVAAPVTPEEFKKTGKLFAPVNQVANAWGMLGPNYHAVPSPNSDTMSALRLAPSER